MTFILANQGERYTPAGHDAAVTSRSLYKGAIDIHTTAFPGGAGMAEEVHPAHSHLFLVLEGSLTVLQHGAVLQTLTCGDAVYIPAGEKHEIRNDTTACATFLAVTFPQAPQEETK